MEVMYSCLACAGLSHHPCYQRETNDEFTWMHAVGEAERSIISPGFPLEIYGPTASSMLWRGWVSEEGKMQSLDPAR